MHLGQLKRGAAVFFVHTSGVARIASSVTRWTYEFFGTRLSLDSHRAGAG